MKHLTDEQISELLDGLFILNQKQQEHLQHCSECQEKLKEWQSISQTLQNLPIQSAPEEITTKISREIHSLKVFPQKVYFPTLRWNYKSFVISMATVLLLIIGISIIYYNYESKNTTDTINIQPVSTINQIASNSNYINTTAKSEEQISLEENILNNLGEQYIQTEPFEEELHQITISELLLSLAEETEEYNISDVSL